VTAVIVLMWICGCRLGDVDAARGHALRRIADVADLVAGGEVVERLLRRDLERRRQLCRGRDADQAHIVADHRLDDASPRRDRHILLHHVREALVVRVAHRLDDVVRLVGRKVGAHDRRDAGRFRLLDDAGDDVRVGGEHSRRDHPSRAVGNLAPRLVAQHH
jgi:hypothetical protein